MNKEDVVQFYKKRILQQLHAMMDAKNKARKRPAHEEK
jgi:pyruvate,water dikinase